MVSRVGLQFVIVLFPGHIHLILTLSNICRPAKCSLTWDRDHIQLSMTKKCHNLRSNRPTNDTARKKHNTNSHATAKRNQSKETSNYFLNQITGKPDRTQSTSIQIKDQTHKLHNIGRNNKQYIKLCFMLSRLINAYQKHIQKYIKHWKNDMILITSE